MSNLSPTLGIKWYHSHIEKVIRNNYEFNIYHIFTNIIHIWIFFLSIMCFIWNLKSYLGLKVVRYQYKKLWVLEFSAKIKDNNKQKYEFAIINNKPA